METFPISKDGVDFLGGPGGFGNPTGITFSTIIQHECSKLLCWLNPAMGFRLQFLPADCAVLAGGWLVGLPSERALVVPVSHSTPYCDPLFQPGRGTGISVEFAGAVCTLSD